MRVIECNLMGKCHDTSLCEDGVKICNSSILVVDGATSSSARLWGKSSGRLGTEALCNSFASLAEERDAFALLCHLNESLTQLREEGRTETGDADWAPRASIVIYQEAFHRVINYGDCQFTINGKRFLNHKKIDLINAKRRADVLRKALRSGASTESLLMHDIGRDAIRDSLIHQHVFENAKGEFGYPVMNGSPLCADLMVVEHVRPGGMLVLASDGYPDLKQTLAATEQRLQELLSEDPICIDTNVQTKGLYPGNSSFDDRTYVRVLVE